LSAWRIGEPDLGTKPLRFLSAISVLDRFAITHINHAPISRLAQQGRGLGSVWLRAALGRWRLFDLDVPNAFDFQNVNGSLVA